MIVWRPHLWSVPAQQADLNIGASRHTQFLEYEVIHRGRVRLDDRAWLRVLDDGWEQG